MPSNVNRLRQLFADALSAEVRDRAMLRFDHEELALMPSLRALYAADVRFVEVIGKWLIALAQSINARPPALRLLDEQRASGWFDRSDMVGYCAYVDRFAGTLAGVERRVGYLRDLGVRYLHLLPFLHTRSGDNDGGFAVRDYGEVDPALGSNTDLASLTAALRAQGISLCADFVLNHTADDHAWAIAAKSGSVTHQDYYHRIADAGLVARYEATLPEVFPVSAPGNFTRVDALDGWVWTTFYPYQWDLNWSNPKVFAEMSLAMLRLANLGVEVFRIDSAAYLWKRLGTACTNLPECHLVLRALRAVAAIAAPGVLLKAEAIMPMRELPRYFGSGGRGGEECHLAYHSSLMAATWAGLATQRADIVASVLTRSPRPPSGCAWINYVRCHDDIGWQVLAHEAAGHGGCAPFDLDWVARFYAGEVAGSYAQGEAFQSQGLEHAHGSNGMAASLVGLHRAIASGDAEQQQLARRRLLLLYGLCLSGAGVPLLYMGDELALGNDESFRLHPQRRLEGRWLHRPAMDWVLADAVDAGDGIAAATHATLRRWIGLRAAHPELAPSAPLRAWTDPGSAVLVVARGENFLALFNFTDHVQTLDLRAPDHGDAWFDLLAGCRCLSPLRIEPYGTHWLVRQ